MATPLASINAGNYFDIIAAKRGWNYDTLRDLDHVAMDELDNMDYFAAGLRHVYENNMPITIWPDYDMDGIAAGTTLYAGLAELGFDVNMVIPDYTGPRNMVPDDVDHIMRMYPNTRAIITCDAGMNSHDGLLYAQSKNILTFVTDHHTEDQRGCQANYVLNPHATASQYQHKDICGAQVAFLALIGYALRYNYPALDAIMRLRLFAGIGALADVMPLRHQNRHDVQSALIYLTLLTPEFPRDKYDRIDAYKKDTSTPHSAALAKIIDARDHHPYYNDAFIGAATLLHELGFSKKLYNTDNYDESIVGFTIAPMFNATRRVQAPMATNMAVFSPSVVDHYVHHGELSPEHNYSSSEAVQRLIENNEQRKKDTQTYLNRVLDAGYHPYAPYAYISPEPIPGGFLGLLAMSLLLSNKSPMTLLVNRNNDGSLSGSGRATDDIDIIAATAHISGARAAGHPQACGVFFDDESALEEFIKFIDAQIIIDPHASPVIDGDLNILDIQGSQALSIPKHIQSIIDAHMDTDAYMNLVAELDMVRPFGHHFEYPTITVIIDPAQCTTSTLAEKHTKITTPSGLVLIKWNTKNTTLEELLHDTVNNQGLIQCTVQCGINTFKDTTVAQGIIQDITAI